MQAKQPNIKKGPPTASWRDDPDFVRVAQEVEKRLVRAIDAFLKAEVDLFRARSRERNLTATLAPSYLRGTFAPWDADPEYARFGTGTKRSYKPSRKPKPNGNPITPDIIVHRRLHPTDNLLAIEAKPDDGDSSKDREKLASYFEKPLLYQYVVLLVFGTEGNAWCSYELSDKVRTPRNRSNQLSVWRLELEVWFVVTFSRTFLIAVRKLENFRLHFRRNPNHVLRLTRCHELSHAL
jgi:hypothetical protein